jgi:RNA-directed DNA polymerase
VEAEIWTERMLTALEQGVNGGKWHSLMDKVYALPNLRQAFARVKANHGAAGVDHVTVEEFERDLEANLEKLSHSLADSSYRPQAVRRHWIQKLGSKEQRPLGIPTVRDRVVQAALRAVLEPIFERDFAAQSYGFRPERGCKDALRRVDTLLKRGYSWVVDADLKSYFDTIPRAELLARVQAKVSDGGVLKLREAFLTQGVLEEMKLWTPEAGTPQGAVISPLLSTIYLDTLDHEMAEKGIEMVRYADDFVVWCGTEGEAQQALEAVRRWTAQAGLTLHPVKTRIMDATPPGGFDFLGYHFEQGRKWPRRKSERKFQDLIRTKTRRTEGQSLSATIVDLNRTLKGWFGYLNTAINLPSPCWTAGCACACAASCATGRADKVGDAERIISAGPTPTLRSSGCSPRTWPTPPPVSPLAGKTTHWRAGCGRSARPVRREGDSNSIVSPYPYPKLRTRNQRG